MEEVIDSIVAQLGTFKNTLSSGGGCLDILPIEAVYWGDPGVIPVNSYPCFTVQPVRDVPNIETTGYEVRDLEVLITLPISCRL